MAYTTGKAAKDPDKRVQEAIELDLKKFREIQSIRQTFFWFRNKRIKFPVNKNVGGVEGIGVKLRGEILIC